MGLHINYELRLPPSTTSDEVTELLERLHGRAESLGFPLMTGMMTWSEGAVEEWHQCFRILTEIVSHFASQEGRARVELGSARGFLVHPGRGCEPASIGLLKCTANAEGNHEWFWYCRCKTQFASVFGDEYFLECHERMVALLDDAIALGVNVIVRDETGYWPSRDRDATLGEVKKMNRIIARFAGAFSDRVSGVGSPIFDHPDFERLASEQ